MLSRFKAFFTGLISPVARALIRAGVSPDVVTIIGTIGVIAGALIFFPQGELFWGTVFITAFVFSDLLDGTMARMMGRSSKWGAFLDSVSDRLGDAAIFGGLVLYFAGDGDDLLLGSLALYGLAMGAAISYSKARAEGLGMTCNVGLFERTDRLVTVLVAAGLSGLGVPYILEAALWVLAVATTITLGQRMLVVRQQALAAGSEQA